MKGLTLIAIIGLIVLLMVNVILITNNQIIVLTFLDINYFVSFLGSMAYFSKSEGKKWGD